MAVYAIRLLESSTLELSQQIEVDTPRGRGRLFLVTDYGSEIEKIFTIVLYNGTMFEYPIDKIRLTQNITMARDSQVNVKTPFCSRGSHVWLHKQGVCSKCGEMKSDDKT